METGIIIQALSESMLFKIAKGIFRYFNILLRLPYLQYVALGFGVFIMFSKEYLIPKKIWRKSLMIA
jgi:hypothetical protein